MAYISEVTIVVPAPKTKSSEKKGKERERVHRHRSSRHRRKKETHESDTQDEAQETCRKDHDRKDHRASIATEKKVEYPSTRKGDSKIDSAKPKINNESSHSRDERHKSSRDRAGERRDRTRETDKGPDTPLQRSSTRGTQPRAASIVSSETSKTTRNASLREPISSTSRPAPARRNSTSQARQPSIRSPSYIEPSTSSTPGAGTRDRRNSAGFASLFGIQPGRNPRRAPETMVECLTCATETPISKTAKLACDHIMCNECLVRIFNMSVTDPQHMPPKCCTADHIPLKHVDKLLDNKFKRLWNQKYQEFTTKNRIYCPTKGCGQWIKPAFIHTDTSGGATHGKKYGKCSHCNTKVCCMCNGKWHVGKDCPDDEETRKFVDIAKQEGWRRCYNCSAMVELKEGCNHMTCRCTAEFCMICAAKWKTCECPLFSYDQPNENVFIPIGLGRRRPPPRYNLDAARRDRQEQADRDMAYRLQMEDFVRNRPDFVHNNENLAALAGVIATGGNIMDDAMRNHVRPYMRNRQRREQQDRDAPPPPPPLPLQRGGLQQPPPPPPPPPPPAEPEAQPPPRNAGVRSPFDPIEPLVPPLRGESRTRRPSATRRYGYTTINQTIRSNNSNNVNNINNPEDTGPHDRNVMEYATEYIRHLPPGPAHHPRWFEEQLLRGRQPLNNSDHIPRSAAHSREREHSMGEPASHPRFARWMDEEPRRSGMAGWGEPVGVQRWLDELAG